METRGEGLVCARKGRERTDMATNKTQGDYGQTPWSDVPAWHTVRPPVIVGTLSGKPVAEKINLDSWMAAFLDERPKYRKQEQNKQEEKDMRTTEQIQKDINANETARGQHISRIDVLDEQAAKLDAEMKAAMEPPAWYVHPTGFEDGTIVVAVGRNGHTCYNEDGAITTYTYGAHASKAWKQIEEREARKIIADNKARLEKAKGPTRIAVGAPFGGESIFPYGDRFRPLADAVSMHGFAGYVYASPGGKETVYTSPFVFRNCHGYLTDMKAGDSDKPEHPIAVLFND